MTVVKELADHETVEQLSGLQGVARGELHVGGGGGGGGRIGSKVRAALVEIGATSSSLKVGPIKKNTEEILVVLTFFELFTPCCYHFGLRPAAAVGRILLPELYSVVGSAGPDLRDS